MHSMVHIRRREALTTFVVASIGSLSQDHARYAPSPQLLDRCQDAACRLQERLSWIAPLDVIKGLFLLNIDQHSSAYGI